MFKVVLIDDEPIIIEGLKKILDWHALGFEIVAVAYDGVDGFSKLLELNPDVALIDIRIPGIDGLLLIQRLREKIFQQKLLFFQVTLSLNMPEKLWNLEWRVIF